MIALDIRRWDVRHLVGASAVALRPNRAPAESHNALPDAARNGFEWPQPRTVAPVNRSTKRS